MNKENVLRSIRTVGEWLDQLVPYILIFIVIFFGAAILQFQEDNRKLLQNTNEIVVKQDQTLDAIKQLAEDSKISDEISRQIITCMLLVPVEERTTNTLNNCHKNTSQSVQSTQSAQPSTPPRQTPTVINGEKQTQSPEAKTSETQQNVVQRLLENIQSKLLNVVDRGM